MLSPKIAIIFAFPIYCAITSLWSLFPSITLGRSLYLILMYSGLLSVSYIYKMYFSDNRLSFLFPANVLILILSVLSILFGVPANRWSGGIGIGFMGFAGHQNILAAAILLTSPGAFYFLLKSRQLRIESAGSTKSVFSDLITHRWMLYLVIIANVFFLIISYSRASILSFFLGIIVYLILIKSYKALIVSAIVGVTLTIMFLTISPINASITRILSKDGGSIFSRRAILWQPSIEAAKLGGLFGFGYGISVPQIKTPVLTGSHYENGRYIREKGNSVFALLEETGWLGLFLFLVPIAVSSRNFFKYRKTLSSSFAGNNKLKFKSNDFITSSILLSSLVALFVHAQFEGWWSGVGSIELPILYVILSQTEFVEIDRSH